MRLTTRQSGVISYAGLDKDVLWAAAKRAFAQADEPVPERFSSFLPIFPVELIQNMSYIGSRGDGTTPVSPRGFSIDPVEYHQKLWAEMPELYQDDNYRRNFNYEGKFIGRGAITVDRAWTTRFPQYQPFIGERLHIYMIGGGHQAVAVPESVYPRGGELLRNAEIELRVTARCEHYISYMKRRLAVGEKYDAVLFESDYLRVNELLPVCVQQSELGRVMQDLCIIRGLNGERPAQRLFTENAKRAEGIAQYSPFRCACDTFSAEPVTRATARLVQLYCEEDDVSDLWLPYQDASEYIDRRRMAIDVYALCHGFQLAPEHDATTCGGRYPTRARVVVVRDRELRPLVADTINNPAYGGGMSPLGMMNRLVYLRDSRELMREGKLSAEEAGFVCENAEVSPEEYRAMVIAATAQELKGRLIDAMYRRESALSQMQVGTRPYMRAKELLDSRVDKLGENVAALGAQTRRGQLSGYDADIDYLERMAQSREGIPREGSEEPAPFVPDALREQSIESGYAMRNGARYVGMSMVSEQENSETEKSDTTDAEKPVVQNTVKPAPEVKPVAEPSRQKPAAAPAKKHPSHPPAIKNTPPAAAPLASPPKLPSAQFEQLRMFGMEAIAPKADAADKRGFATMSGMAEKSAGARFEPNDSNGSMARLVGKKKK